MRLLRFCGHCRYFEIGVFGDDGVCHKGHSPHERAKVGTCADRSDLPVATGPNFDMSE